MKRNGIYIFLELSDDENYKGYWESKGYSNKADIDGTYTD